MEEKREIALRSLELADIPPRPPMMENQMQGKLRLYRVEGFRGLGGLGVLGVLEILWFC